MALQANIDVPAQRSPVRLSYQLFAPTKLDTLWLIGLGSIAFIIWRQLDFLGLLIGLTIVGYFMWPMLWGCRYYEILQAIKGWWIDAILQGVLWATGEALEAYTAGRSWWRKLLASTMPLAHPNPFQVDKLFEYGLIHTVGLNQDSLVIRGDGSNIVSYNLSRQAELLAVIEDLIKRFASYYKLHVQIGLVFRRRPSNPVIFDRNQDQHGEPDVVLPEALVLMQKYPPRTDEEFEDPRVHAKRLYEEGLLSRVQFRQYRQYRIGVQQARECFTDDTNGVDMCLVITIPRTRRLMSATKSPLQQEELRREYIHQLARDAVDALVRATVVNPTVLNPEECQDYLRAAWDVSTLQEYYLQRAQGTPVDITNPVHHPEHVIGARNGLAITDDTAHAIVRMHELPEWIFPDSMNGLLTGDVRWITRTLIAEAERGTGEYFGTSGIGRVFDNLAENLHLPFGKKILKKRAKLEEKEEQLAEDEHRVYSDVYLMESDTDVSTIEMGAEELIRVAKQADGDAFRVEGSARLVPVALTAATGIPLL